MSNVSGRRVLVVGGSSGLGLGVVEALVALDAQVTVLARNGERLRQLRERLGVQTLQGDMTDAAVIESALDAAQPEILILNGGATPHMAPLHEQTWESFGRTWEVDVKANFLWTQALLRQQPVTTTRVLLTSSGAAVNGSPLSGGYAGAKRMVWLLAEYANSVSVAQGLGMRFQAVVPMQIIPGTGVGSVAAEAYARQKGVSVPTLLAKFAAPLPPAAYGRHIVTLLQEPRYDEAQTFMVSGANGLQPVPA